MFHDRHARLVSSEREPPEAAVITVGSIHAGSKTNIICDTAKLQLSVHSESVKTRTMPLEAVRRMAINTARANGAAGKAAAA